MKLELDKAREECVAAVAKLQHMGIERGLELRTSTIRQRAADLQAKTLEIAAKKVIEEAMFNVDSSAQKALMAIDDELLAAAAALREGR